MKLGIEKHESGDYKIIVDNSETPMTLTFKKYSVMWQFCDEFIRNQQTIEHRNERILDLQVEVEQANKKLRQFKRTFVEARALHDLRNFVVRHLHDQRKTSRMLPEVAEAHKNVVDRFDMEMRRFIKQYQDRVEAWPVNVATEDKPAPVITEQGWYDYHQMQAVSLPPVGQVVEGHFDDAWHKGTVKLHDDGVAVLKLTNGEYMPFITLRPLDWQTRGARH